MTKLCTLFQFWCLSNALTHQNLITQALFCHNSLANFKQMIHTVHYIYCYLLFTKICIQINKQTNKPSEMMSLKSCHTCQSFQRLNFNAINGANSILDVTVSCNTIAILCFNITTLVFSGHEMMEILSTFMLISPPPLTQIRTIIWNFFLNMCHLFMNLIYTNSDVYGRLPFSRRLGHIEEQSEGRAKLLKSKMAH